MEKTQALELIRHPQKFNRALLTFFVRFDNLFIQSLWQSTQMVV